MNLWSLSETLLRKNESLEAVKYFSAYATWLPAGYKRHRVYTAALEQEGVELILGNFKKKYLKCPKCGSRYKTREEKETDVNIAVHLVTDGIRDRYDRATLISADTDLVAAVEMARLEFPKKEIFVAAPPGRLGQARGFRCNYEITKGRIANNLLANDYKDAAGNVIVSRPLEFS